ncbi:response regulator transcription factor [Paracoccus sp. (in: a-proteobacteria)]|uniref:response regulator transcription factor n=1 Tax=Paracoccus sp. TaxID=267 RepID=UPI003A84E2AB
MLALVHERLGDPGANALLDEVCGLARIYKLNRVLRDAHPLLDKLARRHEAGRTGDEAVPPQPSLPQPGPAAARSGVLTPKEGEIVDLLSRNLSNKEIGRALDIHEDTVKWHMKNLFAKLNAGSRKQVVTRARLLGLLPTDG